MSTSPSDETRGKQSAAGPGHDPGVHCLTLPRNRITARSQQVPRLGEGALLQCNTERVTACQFVFGDASEDILQLVNATVPAKMLFGDTQCSCKENLPVKPH